MSLNYIAIMGRLTKDVELRHTSTGKAVANFALAVERDRKNDKGEREVDYIDCIAWAGQGEFAHRNLRKGQKIVILGRLQIRDWQDKDGNKRKSAEIVVSSIYFAGSAPNSEEGSLPAQTSNYAPASSGLMQDAYAAIGRLQSARMQELDDDDGEMPF